MGKICGIFPQDLRYFPAMVLYDLMPLFQLEEISFHKVE